MLTDKVGDFDSKVARLVDRARHNFTLGNNAVRQANAVIVFTKRRSLVNDAGTTVIRNVAVSENAERLVFTL